MSRPEVFRSDAAVHGMPPDVPIIANFQLHNPDADSARFTADHPPRRDADDT